MASVWVRKSEGVPVKAWDFLQLLVQEEVGISTLTPSSAGRLLRGGSSPTELQLLCLKPQIL